MKRQISVLIILLTIATLAFAQETALQLGNAPKELPTIDPSLSELTWQRIVKSHYTIFASQDSFLDDTSSFATKQLVVAMLGCFWDCHYKDDLADFSKFGELLENPTSYNKIIKSFYKSPSQQQALYKWVKPFYLDAFKKLPKWKKEICKQMLAYAKNCLLEFDYDAELLLLSKDRIRWEDVGPKEQRIFDFRRIDWFIFRRVHNGDLTVQQMLDWVNVLQQDIDLIEQN